MDRKCGLWQVTSNQGNGSTLQNREETWCIHFHPVIILRTSNCTQHALLPDELLDRNWDSMQERKFILLIFLNGSLSFLIALNGHLHGWFEKLFGREAQLSSVFL